MRLSTGIEIYRKNKEGTVFGWKDRPKNARIQMLPYSYLDEEIMATLKFAELKEGLESEHDQSTGQ